MKRTEKLSSEVRNLERKMTNKENETANLAALKMTILAEQKKLLESLDKIYKAYEESNSEKDSNHIKTISAVLDSL